MEAGEKGPQGTKCRVSQSERLEVMGRRWGGGHTTLRFPAPGLRTSSPPGPMLLLRDFFRPAAMVLPTSTVAFSLSPSFRDGDWPPTDLRDLRVAGSVASARDAILRFGYVHRPVYGVSSDKPTRVSFLEGSIE